jgi:hypothetical protein
MSRSPHRFLLRAERDAALEQCEQLFIDPVNVFLHQRLKLVARMHQLHDEVAHLLILLFGLPSPTTHRPHTPNITTTSVSPKMEIAMCS